MGLVKLEGLYHRLDAAQVGPLCRLFVVRCVAASHATHGTSSDEIHDRDLERLAVERHTDNDEGTVPGQKRDEPAGRFTRGRSGDGGLCAAELLDLGGYVVFRSSKDVVSAQLLGKVCLTGRACQCNDLEAHRTCVLQSEMAQAAETLNDDDIAGLGVADHEGLVNCVAGTEQRSQLGVAHVELVWQANKGTLFSDDVLLMTAILEDARDLGVLTSGEVGMSAGSAVLADTSIPANTDLGTIVPELAIDLVTERYDSTDNLVTCEGKSLQMVSNQSCDMVIGASLIMLTRSHGVRNTREKALDSHVVASTNTASRDLDEHLVGTGSGRVYGDDFELAALLLDLRGLVLLRDGHHYFVMEKASSCLSGKEIEFDVVGGRKRKKKRTFYQTLGWS